MKKFILALTAAATIMVSSLFLSSCEKENNVLPQYDIWSTNSTVLTIKSIILEPNTINAGGAIFISVDAGYTDNDALKFTYEVSGGTVEGHGSMAMWKTPSSAGNHTVKVTVSDGKGGEGIKTQSVYIPPTTTMLSGFVKLQTSAPLSDLKGAKVYLYETYTDFMSGSFCTSKAVCGCERYVVFNISDIHPGYYYLAIGKDQAGNKSSSATRITGWFNNESILNTGPDPIKVEDGKASFCTVSL